MWSGDHLGGPKVIGTPFGIPEVVGRPSCRSGSGRETLSQVQKWSGDFPAGPEVVGRPSRRSGTGQETLLEVW